MHVFLAFIVKYDKQKYFEKQVLLAHRTVLGASSYSNNLLAKCSWPTAGSFNVKDKFELEKYCCLIQQWYLVYLKAIKQHYHIANTTFGCTYSKYWKADGILEINYQNNSLTNLFTYCVWRPVWEYLDPPLENTGAIGNLLVVPLMKKSNPFLKCIWCERYFSRCIV